MLIKYSLSPFLLCPVMYKSLLRVDSTVKRTELTKCVPKKPMVAICMKHQRIEL